MAEAIGSAAGAALGGIGGKGGSSQSATLQPFGPSVPLLNQVGDSALGLFNADPTGQNLVAPFNADQNAGFDLTRGLVGQQSDLLGAASGSIGNIFNRTGQEFLQPVIDNAVGVATRNANQQARAFGRQGSPAAFEALSRAAVEASAPIAFQADQANIGNQLRAAGLAPNIAQSQLIPAQALLGIGGQQQQQQQQQLDAPFTQLNRLANIAFPLASAGRTTTQTTPGVGGLQGALGGGLLGAQFGNAFGGNGFADFIGFNPFAF